MRAPKGRFNFIPFENDDPRFRIIYKTSSILKSDLCSQFWFAFKKKKLSSFFIDHPVIIHLLRLLRSSLPISLWKLKKIAKENENERDSLTLQKICLNISCSTFCFFNQMFFNFHKKKVSFCYRLIKKIKIIKNVGNT